MSSPSIPTSARRLGVREFSTDFRKATHIVQFDLPQRLQPGQVLVRHHYVGINASDVNFTAGWYTGRDSKPEELQAGFEAIGVVVAVGEGVAGLKPGDAVAATGNGAFSDYKVYPDARALIPLPSPDAAFLPLLVSALTASVALEQVGDLRPASEVGQETVLVTAGAGGTGVFACQLAKLAGHHVIATAGSDDKCEFLKSLGVHRAINYKKEKLADVLKREYPKGVNLVYESVGGQMLMDCVKALAVRGRLIVIGMISGYADGSAWKGSSDQASIPALLLPKSASVRGFFLPNFPDASKRHMQQLIKQMQSGQIKSIVDSTRFKGLEAVADAIDHMYAGGNVGKVIVDLAPEAHSQKKSSL